MLYPDPVPTLDFIACPAVKYPLLTEEDELSEDDCVQLARKIKTILQVAKIHGHDTVIFGAMGCGAWQNPVKCVARVFKEVLQEYDGWLSNYVFAILKDVEYDSDSEEGGSNYDVFKNILFTKSFRSYIKLAGGGDNDGKQIVFEKTKGGIPIVYTIDAKPLSGSL